VTTIIEIHRDTHLIVVEKPSGMLSVPGRGPEKADCLVARLTETYPTARIVHRLDQPTSGLIVLAFDAETHRRLGRQFEERKVGKRYVAVAHGAIEADEGRIDLPIRLDVDNRPYQIVDHERGKAATTFYRVLERQADRTRVELTPLTGRSHQLRVHLQQLGHPILGDDLYAPPAVRSMSPRLLLHASWLAIAHPMSGERLVFESRVPF
jgi:tRNA pseudouridine32 synthase/23S rRNA pseudouridine746 synthase